MLVELLTARVHARGVDQCGDVIEVPEDEGGRLLASGQAVPPTCQAVAPTSQVMPVVVPLAAAVGERVQKVNNYKAVGPVSPTRKR